MLKTYFLFALVAFLAAALIRAYIRTPELFGIPDRPIRFASSDEVAAVHGAAMFAHDRLRMTTGDLRLRFALAMKTVPVILPLARIPVDELIILAPFIDDMINGSGPPLNLPAEYEDWRPAVLAAFKKRMIGEGFWPESSA